MEFLDKETEAILKQCVDNEGTYPQILCDILEQCKSSLDRVHLRERINGLVKNGYLSKISWADNLPYIGHIEPKGLDYFKIKDIYVRAMLRKNPNFSLSAESEECLKKLTDIESDDPYVIISQHIGTVSAVQDLANQGFIQLGPKGISTYTTGGFNAVVMILPKGKTYFQDKADYIEEILTFPQNDGLTQINISSGNNSQIQVGTVNSQQSIEYDFELAQAALNEVLSKIDELGLKLEEKQDLLDNIEEAQKLVREKKKSPLKTILKGIWDVIKDVGCSITSSLIISKIQ